MEKMPGAQSEKDIEMQDAVFDQLNRSLNGQDLSAELIRQSISDLREDITADLAITESVEEKAELQRRYDLLGNKGEEYINWKLTKVTSAS